jgi:hypothetical protein
LVHVHEHQMWRKVDVPQSHGWSFWGISLTESLLVFLSYAYRPYALDKYNDVFISMACFKCIYLLTAGHILYGWFWNVKLNATRLCHGFEFDYRQKTWGLILKYWGFTRWLRRYNGSSYLCTGDIVEQFLA